MIRKLFILVLIGSSTLFSCKKEAKKETDLTVLHATPFNAKFIIQINDKTAFIKDIKQEQTRLLFNKKIAKEIRENLNATNLITKTKSLLLASSNEDTTLLVINKINPLEKKNISLKIETDREYNGITIKKITQLEKPYYFAEYNSLLLSSFSNILIENAIRQLNEKVNILNDSTFVKAYKSIDQSALANLLINNNKTDLVQLNPFDFKQNTYSNSAYSDWTALDISKTKNQVLLNGISLSKEQEDYLKPFKGIKNNSHKIINTIPSNTTNYKGIALDDFKAFKKQLNLISGKSNTKLTDSIVPILKEVAVFYSNKQEILAIRTDDAEKLKTLLLDKIYIEMQRPYHNAFIQTIADKGIFKSFLYPFIQQNEVSCYFEKDAVFYFSKDVKTLQHLINNQENASFLLKNKSINSTINTANDGAFLLFEKSKQKPISLIINNYSYSDDIAYTNIFIQNNIIIKNSLEQATINLETPLKNKPQFFYNFKKKEKQLVLSGKNYIRLLSKGGKQLWEKEIAGEILGKIKEIDLYKNNKKQLLFTTQNALYCLDINGDNVGEFPIKIKGITQSVALFDYDNNKKYRIAIVTGKSLYLYDVNGKKIDGFSYKGKSKLVSTPQHFRSFGKDYIVSKTKDDKLIILNRRGEIRTPVNETFTFSKNPLYFDGRFITFTDKKGSKIQINIASGKVLKKALNLHKKHFSYSDKKYFVTFDKNTLKINSKTITLPLGKYQEPLIITTKKQLFVILLNEEEHKIYAYNSKGEKLVNFPVFGTDFVVGTLDKNKVVLLSQEDEQHLIRYQF